MDGSRTMPDGTRNECGGLTTGCRHSLVLRRALGLRPGKFAVVEQWLSDCLAVGKKEGEVCDGLLLLRLAGRALTVDGKKMKFSMA